MYKSPIDIIMSEIKFDIAKQQEENIVKAIQEYGIDINYDELIKALNYDRNQYNKGYEDGYKDGAIKNKEKAISKLKEIPSHFRKRNNPLRKRNISLRKRNILLRNKNIPLRKKNILLRRKIFHEAPKPQ